MGVGVGRLLHRNTHYRRGVLLLSEARPNSLYISVTATELVFLNLGAIPAAYALSRFRFIGRTNFRRFLLISQMLSPIVLVLGLFRILVLFGALDNANVVAVLYDGFNAAFSVWILERCFSTTEMKKPAGSGRRAYFRNPWIISGCRFGDRNCRHYCGQALALRQNRPFVCLLHLLSPISPSRLRIALRRCDVSRIGAKTAPTFEQTGKHIGPGSI